MQDVTPKFCTNSRERKTIGQIARRAQSFYKKHGHTMYVQDICMDLEACHCNGCPLRLNDLLNANNSNLMHDVGGIYRHLNRETGELMDCFVPRYAEKQ